MNIGTTSVSIISDGTVLVDGGSVFGQIPKTEWELVVKPDRRNRIKMGLNCLLIKTPDTNILVDTGTGSKRSDQLKETYGLNGNKLLKGLRAHGLTARDIHIVIQTSLQFDHGGGCTKLDRTGDALPTFPKAQYMVQRAAWEEANAPNERYKSSYHAGDFKPLHERGVLSLLDGETEVIPGVTVKVADGPSNGHQIVLVERGGEKIAYMSDLIPTSHHLPLPYIPAQDEHPNSSLDQKRKMLEMAVGAGWLLVFGHGHDRHAGYVEQRNGKVQLRPVEL